MPGSRAELQQLPTRLASRWRKLEAPGRRSWLLGLSRAGAVPGGRARAEPRPRPAGGARGAWRHRSCPGRGGGGARGGLSGPGVPAPARPRTRLEGARRAWKTRRTGPEVGAPVLGPSRGRAVVRGNRAQACVTPVLPAHETWEVESRRG